jgi:DNA-directed RNA polymerase specialized sigma24 family protein
MENTKYPSGETLLAAQKQFEALIMSGALRVCERAVHYAHDREDRVQEGLAFAWAWYSQQAARGNVPDTALVVHVAKLRTRDRTRRFIRAEGARWGEDVYVQQERGIELRRLEAVHDHDSEEERHEDHSLGLARLGVGNPESNVVSAFDLVAWTDNLSSDDRQLLARRYEGFGLEEIGKETGRSVAGVFRRARQLGLELAARAEVEVAR